MLEQLEELPITWTVIAVAATLLFLLLLWWLIRRLRQRGLAEFEAVDSLLSTGEQAFLPALRNALTREEILLARVRVADILQPNPALSGKRQRKARARIETEHVDFLVCTANNLRPLVVVELDDNGHGRARRRQRDQLLDRACAAAGLPLLRVAAAVSYDSDTLRKAIERELAPPPAEEPAGEPTSAGPMTPDGRREPILDLPDDPDATGDSVDAPGRREPEIRDDEPSRP